jgi:hypothetical protein
LKLESFFQRKKFLKADAADYTLAAPLLLLFSLL